MSMLHINLEGGQVKLHSRQWKFGSYVFWWVCCGVGYGWAVVALSS